jgi:hypothetical protein
MAIAPLSSFLAALRRQFFLVKIVNNTGEIRDRFKQMEVSNAAD